MRLPIIIIFFTICTALPAQTYKLVITVVDSAGQPLPDVQLISTDGSTETSRKYGLITFRYPREVGKRYYYEISQLKYYKIDFGLTHNDTSTVYKTIILDKPKPVWQSSITMYDYLESSSFDFSYYLKSAWERKDTVLFKMLVNSLTDTLSRNTFYMRVNSLCNITNVWYGYEDYLIYPPATCAPRPTMNMRKNILEVYKIYTSSCLLFKDLPKMDKSIHRKYFLYDKIFTKDELADISMIINNMCK
jgi:hypothetical protein